MSLDAAQISRALAEWTPQREAARAEAMDEARRLGSARLGELERAEFEQLFGLFHTDARAGRATGHRFSQAFTGRSANSLLEHIDELNHWTARLWTARTDDEVAAVIDDTIRTWRAAEAERAGVPRYVVLTNRDVGAIVRRRPETRESSMRARSTASPGWVGFGRSTCGSSRRLTATCVKPSSARPFAGISTIGSPARSSVRRPCASAGGRGLARRSLPGSAQRRPRHRHGLERVGQACAAESEMRAATHAETDEIFADEFFVG